MQQTGYYRFPTISDNTVIFVCEDDLWTVSADGGTAIRLTTNLGEVTRPYLSPDGRYVAFTGREEGSTEVYCMPAGGGPEKRLTFLGSMVSVAGWSRDGKKIIFASNAAQPFQRIFMLYAVSPEGGIPEKLPVGIAQNISYAPRGGVVIGRNTGDPARWKRYRGGTAGVLWVDPTGKGKFRKLIELSGNLASPMWIGSRIYFLSDHEGIGNLYSCTPEGNDLQRHTNSVDFYVRNASSDGRRIVYHAGGELCLFDPVRDESHTIAIEFHSSQVQRQRKFVDSGQYLDDYTIHPEGHSMIAVTRGKPFVFANWEGPVMQLGEQQGVRYQLTQWLNDKKRFVTISDAGGEEALEIHSTDMAFKTLRLDKLNIGRALDLEVSPTEDKVALSNHRFELVLVDLVGKKARVLDKSEHQRIAGLGWSPDGQWIVYSCAETHYTFSIKICNIKTGKVYRLTDKRFRDIDPSFDPEGKFIYFLSYREFNPVYDSMYFDLGFPRGMRPYLISLQKDTPSPFVPRPRSPLEDKLTKLNDVEKSKRSVKQPVTPVKIDLEGIEHRIAAFPVPEGRYMQIRGIKGKVLFTSEPIKGSLDINYDSAAPEDDGTLEVYDLEDQKREIIATRVSSFKISRESSTLIYRSGDKLRITPIVSNSDKGKDLTPNRATGWIDLKRIKLSVVPTLEWKQMYREIWRLQREHFWTADMSGINWEKVFKQYASLLDKISTRSEFSDLIWEMQAELGTSHAYEYGGDYRRQPNYQQGFLGADLEYDHKTDGYRISHIIQGDDWNATVGSPLYRIGTNVKEGEILIAVNGQKVSRERSYQELLVNQAEAEIALTFAGIRGGASRTVTVKASSGETAARYREWVEANRSMVHEATGGRVGYVHVPNMGPLGYAEFHRYYFAEAEREGLLVDVRYNGGGHVSQLLLEKLARKRIGYDIKRWGKPEPYPGDSVLGPIVTLTNEYAGSDGDIFSHSFKLMKLGKLVGKRTWGGVIGIWPRHFLVDRSITTQPEFSFWFTDVGWQVENYGTDPDVEVEITPQDWVKGYDRQLDSGIKIILDELKHSPVRVPDFGPKPVLALPEQVFQMNHRKK